MLLCILMVRYMPIIIQMDPVVAGGCASFSYVSAMSHDAELSPGPDVFRAVTRSFLIATSDEMIEPLEKLILSDPLCRSLVDNVSSGLHGVISAASLPFSLTSESINKRRFNQFYTAARIRGLTFEDNGNLSKEQDILAFERARIEMENFRNSKDGSNFIANTIVLELSRALSSRDIGAAAAELMNQALSSTWSIFENFASSFIVEWINSDPRRASKVLNCPGLKSYFGKFSIDLDTINENLFDLTKSMGSVLFKGKRLDNINVIRSAISALLSNLNVSKIIGNDLWLLNQRRHLLVHKRGLIDREYLSRTGDKMNIGDSIIVTSDDIIKYILAVRQAVIAIVEAAEKEKEISEE
ncbi:hypothetical protein C8P66_10562 [Humitalea rosea]|uniref:RiboL-PSP-HEPN domain-containing protein n=2 Tax=Humitalea rosea TaxID=990373 RepID=A0A2W7IMA2_9PROT|nr:hypothetical protein C8P66_10562 [Humitalea rosea]